MGTITVRQAGLEYDIVSSNKGVRVERHGQEIFKHFPGDIVPQAGTVVDDPAKLAGLMDGATPGEQFILHPGVYRVSMDPTDGFPFEALDGHTIKRVRLL